MKLLSDIYPPLADDSIIIRQEDQFCCYQTHFIEKESWIKKCSDRYEIHRIFFLHKSDHFQIKKAINKEYIIRQIMKQLCLQKRDQFDEYIKYVFQLVNDYSNFYDMYFTKEKSKLQKLLRRN